MEWAVFWRIVEGARAEVGSDTERVARALLRRLRALAPSEIEQFEELLVPGTGRALQLVNPGRRDAAVWSLERG
ncbi:DUF4240 domain-containing protein [Micromonospora sp. NPDC005113]